MSFSFKERVILIKKHTNTQLRKYKRQKLFFKNINIIYKSPAIQNKQKNGEKENIRKQLLISGIKREHHYTY